MSLQRQTTTVFFAPTAKRRFFTRQAAAQAEARALIRKKHPSERAEADTGYRGWHWSEDERLCRLHKRLARRIASHSSAEGSRP